MSSQESKYQFYKVDCVVFNLLIVILSSFFKCKNVMSVSLFYPFC